MGREKKDIIRNLLHGGCVGVANIIPGVSGGTVAVVLGIYERVIGAISGVIGRSGKRLESFVYLCQLGMGAVVAVLSLAKVMGYLLEHHNAPTMFLFAGLIAGSIPSVVKMQKDMRLSPLRLVMFLLGAALIIWFSLQDKDKTVVGAESLAFLGLAGVLAGGAMIVPGVSGSFMLVLLGQYHFMITAINNRALVPIAVFGAAVAVGVVLFAAIMRVCMKHFPSVTFYFVLGLIIASLYEIYPGIPDDRMPRIVCALCLVVGLAGSLILARSGSEKPNHA